MLVSLIISLFLSARGRKRMRGALKKREISRTWVPLVLAVGRQVGGGRRPFETRGPERQHHPQQRWASEGREDEIPREEDLAERLVNGLPDSSVSTTPASTRSRPTAVHKDAMSAAQ